MLSRILDRILHIHIQEPISLSLSKRVQKGLKSLNFYNVKLITVYIDSEGGSLVQAKQIVSALNIFSAQTLAPIYCFAGAQVLSSANIVLTCGNKVYASPYSSIGEFGYSERLFNMKNLIEQQNIEQRSFQQGEYKQKLSPFEDVKERDLLWYNSIENRMQKIVNDKEYHLKREIVRQRQIKFLEKKVGDKEMKDIMDGPSFNSSIAQQIGLIDHIASMDEVLNQYYNGVKIIYATQPRLSSFKMELIERVMSQ